MGRPFLGQEIQRRMNGIQAVFNLVPRLGGMERFYRPE
jgi:hypothetical protein